LIQISNDRIEFRHQLIQEYYAAEWLLGLLPSLSDARLQHVYLNYLKWTEPLALMLELVEGEEQVVRVVRLALEVDLRLGARLAGAVKYGFQEKTVGLLMREIEERKIPQLYAIEILAETRSDKTVKPLILALKDSDDWVRIKAVEALGNIGSDKAVDPLIPTLNESHHNVRCEAAKALGNIGSDKAVDPLIQLFNSDEYLHKEVAEALAHIGSDKAVEFLIQLRNSDKCLLENALEVLTNIRSQIQYVPTKETWVSDETIESLILALNDSDDGVRRDAAEALGKISSDKAVEPLIEALKDLGDDDVRMSAVEALGKIVRDNAVEPLIEALKDLDNYLRMRAVEALGKIGSDKVIEPLIQSLKDSDDFVRMSAVEALGMIGSDKVIEPLIQSLKDLDDFVLRIAVEALGKIGNDKAVEPLIQTFKDKDPYVRWRVLEALGKIGSDKAVEPLIEVLKYLGDDDVRWRVLEALGKIGSDKAVNPLIEALKDKDPYVRRSAVEALGRIADIDHNLPVLTQQLPYLLTLISTEASQEAISVITAIQARCKYYDYNIAQTPSQETENHGNPVECSLNELTKAVKKMSDAPKYDLRGAKIDKLIDNIGVYNENNFAPEQKQNLADAAKEIQDLLDQLAKTYPSATEAEAKDIVKATFEEIKTKHPDKWKVLRSQLLNRERWLNGGKAALSETAKHYAENSIILKAGIAFLDGFSADDE
jgi:HEAT repeat protein